jgi:DNA-binding NtrC family response regulator
MSGMNEVMSAHVLIVDDEPLMVWSLSQILVEAGDIVTEAESAATALRALVDAPRPADVILLDYSLPDSQTLVLLSVIRRLVPRAAVILMSAHCTPDLAKQALELGAYRVLSKPIDMAVIPALVHEAAHSGNQGGLGAQRLVQH